MSDNTADVPPEVRAQIEADVRRTLVEMAADPNRGPGASPPDVPVDVFVDVEPLFGGSRITTSQLPNMKTPGLGAAWKATK